MQLSSRLLVVTDRHQTNGRPLVPLLQRVLAAAGPAIQIREHDLSAGELVALAREMQTVTALRRCELLINDRIDVALGLMHSPTLLFLDEPSTGMDPQNRANLWEHIDRLRERQQTTIGLTTHYLEEADSQAERVLVIDHGKIIADDTAANLKATLAGDRIAVTVDHADADAAAAIMVGRGRELSRSDSALGAELVGRQGFCGRQVEGGGAAAVRRLGAVQERREDRYQISERLARGGACGNDH